MTNVQAGVKVSGFAPRVAALESILYIIIDRIKDIPKPPDAQARKEATQVSVVDAAKSCSLFFGDAGGRGGVGESRSSPCFIASSAVQSFGTFKKMRHHANADAHAVCGKREGSSHIWRRCQTS